MITREELYALVWSVSGKAAADRLGVSDSYLGKVCAALAVPRPPRGWWAKRAVGTAPPPPPLAAARPGFPDRWTKGGRGTPPIKHFYGDGIWSASPDDDTVHPLVGIARRVFGSAKESRDGTHLVTRYHTIDLTASADALENALSLADALFRAFEGRGHPVRIAPRSGFIRPRLDNWGRPPSHIEGVGTFLWTPQAPTIATVSGVPVGIAILEINEEILMRYKGNGVFAKASATKQVAGITWTEWRGVPCGRLKLTAYSPHHPVPWRREWIEIRRNSLAKTAEAIVAELEAAAPTLPHAGFFLRG
ncbi:hypothetical protein I6F26_00280 [Ensifer sp. IC3342]|nr:hypothetical protein [Ensifer sp. BRP08]MCA1445032.1 hypothetical protein [Ensifer sp. IC3342]